MFPQAQRGQSAVIVALALVALLAIVGLAIDGGMTMLRKQQLQKAVDAAALAGITELIGGEVDDANQRGQQLMAANGVISSSADQCPDEPIPQDFWDNHDYCGDLRPGNFPGAIRYKVEAHTVHNTFFMQVVGIDTVVVRATATAEYFALVDMYANDVGSAGLVAASNQSIFGPDICVGYGDPYTPTTSPWYDELGGVYTYRIAIPAEYEHDNVRVELFDPDTANTANDDHTIYSLTGNTEDDDCNSRKDTCLLDVPWSGSGDNPNPYWFARIDENRGNGSIGCNRGSGYNESTNTTTVYRLFYYEENLDGSLQEVDLAYYLGKPNNSDGTDMHWVSPVHTSTPLAEMMPAYDGTDEQCVFEELTLNFPLAITIPSNDLCAGAEPVALVEDCDTYRAANPDYSNANRCEGNGDFIINLDTELDGILTLPGSERRDVYLQVRGISGASENGYSLWAGPARSDAPDLVTVPSNINARQTYIQTAKTSGVSVHTSEGIGVFGLGHLPMNSNENAVTDVPLTYIGPELSGQGLNIDMFDPDSGASPPILFYFDTVSQTDWAACFGSEQDCQRDFGQPSQGPAAFTNNEWVNGYGNGYSFVIPSDDVGVPFYGGRLTARYETGRNDTYGWKITLDARPTLVD